MKQEIKIWVVTYLFIFPLLIYAQDIQETVVKSDSATLARIKQAENSKIIFIINILIMCCL